jgi:hypothetical protein
MPNLSETHVPATVYLQLEPDWNYSRSNVIGAKVVRHSQKKPVRPVGGSVTVKMTIHVPRGAFLPLQPEAIVVIPENMTMTEPVHVEALPPEDETDG